MTKIKLCGLKRPCDIVVANEIKPDYIGFVFVENRKRYVSPLLAKELKAALDPEILAVGVFIDEELEEVTKLLEAGIIDVAQLHGKEDDDYIKELKAKTGKPVFKAFQIHEEEDLKEVEACSADLVLLDSGTGTGKAFDWNLLKNVRREFILAGGLNLENVQSAIETVKPYGLDVSSGIETEGLKDPAKMREFVRIARACS